MHHSLGKIFAEIEDQRLGLLGQIKPLSQESLNHSPVAGAWSLAQVFSHIITSERLTLNYIKKKVQAAETLSDSGVWEDVKSALLTLTQRAPGIKFRAPKGIVEKTVAYGSYPEIEQAWIDLRMEFKSFLDAYPDKFIRRKVVRHPFAGYLNIIQGVTFLHNHIIHHTPQIQKLLHRQPML
jgi:uncharacterized damage-inducible protein DinB